MNMALKSAGKVLATLAVGLLVGASAALGQSYPDKPIRWIVPLPPGGGMDILTRIVTTPLSGRLSQPILVDNRPGATGAIGVSLVAKSAPDGYTLLTGEMGMLAMNPSLFKKLPYDAMKDLQPISLFGKIPLFLVVNPDRVPVSSWPEFMAYAKSRQGQLTYASFGSGSINHVMMELLKRRSNLDLLHVPYKGGAPAVQDLLGGQVDMMFSDYSQLEGYIKAGKVRVIGVSTQARHPQLPNLPSLQEAGLPDFDIASWLGVLAPAGTPTAVVERINKDIAEVMRLPAVIKTYTERGIIPTSSTPAEFQKQLRDDLVKWDAVIKASKIEVE